MRAGDRRHSTSWVLRTSVRKPRTEAFGWYGEPPGRNGSEARRPPQGDTPAQTRTRHRTTSVLVSVLRGHANYYGVPGNSPALKSFRHQVRDAWHRQLQRRSQRARWTRKNESASNLASLYRSSGSVIHDRNDASTLSALARRPEVGARCGKSARRALCGGGRKGVPTATAVASLKNLNRYPAVVGEGVPASTIGNAPILSVAPAAGQVPQPGR